MTYAAAFVQAAICAFLAGRLVVRGSVTALYCGVMAIFFAGYHVIPVLYPEESGISRFSTGDVVQVQLMNLLFLIAILLGFSAGPKQLAQSKTEVRISAVVFRSPRVLFYACALVYGFNFFNNDLTSYAAEDFEMYFAERPFSRSFLSLLGSYAQALMAVCMAITYREGKSRSFLLMAATYSLMVVALMSVGQRLAVLAPCVMLVAAFFASGLAPQARKILFASILLLGLLSPFAVFLREAASPQVGKAKVLDVASEFSYENGPVAEGMKSLARRADLVANSVTLKKFFDIDHIAGPTYYLSALFSWVPKALLPNKPYPLSTDGTASTEISILAWRLNIGNSTGSLSAFGAIAAYRELGWLGVLLNGLATGLLGRYVCARWAGGTPFSKLFFVLALGPLVVKKAPASLFEALVELIPLFIVYFSVIAVARIRFRARSVIVGS